MSFVVKLESPPGTTAPSRKFETGASLRVGEHISSVLGGPAWGVDIQIDISSTAGDYFSPLYAYDKSNLNGDAWQDFTLPNVNCKASIRAIATFGSSQETTIVPISIGSHEPDPLPKPELGMDYLTKILIGAGIGLVALGALYLLINRRQNNPIKRLKGR